MTGIRESKYGRKQNRGKKEEFKARKTFELRNVNRYYDPQMDVEYTTADIVTGGAE